MVRGRLTILVACFSFLSLRGFDSSSTGFPLIDSSISNLYAQKDRFPYRLYEDRAEGIVSQKPQLVAGEKLVLVAAKIENKETTHDESIPHFKLGFYLNDPAAVSLEVWEFEKLYKLKLLQVTYATGRNEFSWPSIIPLYYKIALKDLFPLARVVGSHDQEVIPVVLYYNKPELLEASYNFCFISRHEVDTLKYKIIESQTLKLGYSDILRNCRAGETISVRWNGKNQANIGMKSGTYTLIVQATFRPRPGTKPLTVTTKFQFYHRAELLEGASF